MKRLLRHIGYMEFYKVVAISCLVSILPGAIFGLLVNESEDKIHLLGWIFSTDRMVAGMLGWAFSTVFCIIFVSAFQITEMIRK